MTSQILALARIHVGSGQMVSSAQLALDDAAKLFARGDDANAARRALTSLKYSVGIFHPAFAMAASMIGNGAR